MSAHDSKHPQGQDAPSSDAGALPFAPTLRKLILLLVVGFAVPVIILVVIARMIAAEHQPPASSEAVTAQAAAPASSAAPAAAAASAAAPAGAAASQPAASHPAAAAATVADADAGKDLYQSTCIACHGAGVMGAPKFGDKAAWAPLVAKGMPTLYERAIKGYSSNGHMMPPKGGSTASDATVKAAVDYMVKHSG